jgi:hypothetical protein
VAGLLSRAAIAVAMTLIAIGLVIAAIGFLVAALYFYLLSLAVMPALAALIVGLALIGLAGLVLIAVWIAFGRAKTKSGRDSIGTQLGTRVASEAASAAEAHPYAASSVAFLAGLALGGSPDLRDLVKTALRASDRGGGAK